MLGAGPDQSLSLPPGGDGNLFLLRGRRQDAHAAGNDRRGARRIRRAPAGRVARIHQRPHPNAAVPCALRRGHGEPTFRMARQSRLEAIVARCRILSAAPAGLITQQEPRARSGLRAPGLEVGVGHGREFLDEGDDRPDLLVRHLDHAEARHAGHVDAVLDDPEQVLGGPLAGDLLEIGRIRPQSFRELRPVHARPAMAVHATPLGEGLRPRLDHRGIVERHRRLLLGVVRDRGLPHMHQRPFHESRLVRGAGDTVESAEEEHRGSDRTEDGKEADQGQKLQHELFSGLSAG